MSALPTTVVIELQRSAGTVSGSIAVDGGSESEFFGWLELADRLERAATGTGKPATSAGEIDVQKRGKPT